MSDSASEGSNPERRRQPRVPCTVSVLLQAENVYGQGHLADLAPDGVRVQSRLQTERGDAVSVRYSSNDLPAAVEASPSRLVAQT